MKINYQWHDLKEAAKGSITGIIGLLLFFVIGDQSKTQVLNPQVGFLLTLFFLFLCYFSIKPYFNGGAFTHLLIDYVIALLVSIIAGIVFIGSDLVFWSFSFFGTMPIVVSWIILIPALVFDIKNTGSIIEKWTYYGGNGGNGKVGNSHKLISNPLLSYCQGKYKTEEQVKECLRK